MDTNNVRRLIALYEEQLNAFSDLVELAFAIASESLRAGEDAASAVMIGMTERIREIDPAMMIIRKKIEDLKARLIIET